MTSRRTFSLPLSLAMLACALATTAAAQTVTVTGVVETAGPSICLDGTHVLECTSVRLKSDVVDLDAFLGQNVRLVGEQTAPCPVITVEQVFPFPLATLVACGAPTPGCPMRFRVGPAAVSQFLLFASGTPGYAPAGPVKGTWLLGAPVVLVASGSLDPVDVVIPDDPAVIGLSVWLQAARRDIGPIGPWTLSNAVCFTITGPSPPCFSLDC